MSEHSLIKIEQKIESFDITKIIEYSKKIRDFASLNRMMVPNYLKDYIIGYDITSSALANVTKLLLESESVLKTCESIAYLDRASEYLKSKEIKDTSGAREMYIAIDEDVIRAKDLVAKLTALQMLLKHKLMAFKLAHDSLKKVYYSDDGGTSYEGM